MIAKHSGAHFGRPYIMIMLENESDHRYIRYIVTIPYEMSTSDSAVLRKMEMIQKDISKNITIKKHYNT